ncbi:hypothetical protein OS493_011006 [Desmophyllum pertusum]|uniref:Uncharacterized protein n=1 Tax=Desmophyllum pertusum TaxID=174260 RepID=A0A9W9ZFC5_9CNID|nr:hypothetical protein OS493_011006 [Desmophyllum pertusum]
MSQSLATLENKVAADYALLFARKGTSDYVITRGMPSLTAVTVCFWMKTADRGNAGAPLTYAVSGTGNEFTLLDYRNFRLYVGDSHRLSPTYIKMKNFNSCSIQVCLGDLSIQIIRDTLFNLLTGKLDAMNKTIETLSKTVESLDENIKRKLDLMNKSNAGLSVKVQAMSQRLTTLERQGADYALLFPRRGTGDYVITRGMPSLTAVTVCFWMKTSDTGNEGTPLSYAVPGRDNEWDLVDYRNFLFWVGGSHRYEKCSSYLKLTFHSDV